jgi:hypothetical protein
LHRRAALLAHGRYVCSSWKRSECDSFSCPTVTLMAHIGNAVTYENQCFVSSTILANKIIRFQGVYRLDIHYLLLLPVHSGDRSSKNTEYFSTTTHNHYLLSALYCHIYIVYTATPTVLPSTVSTAIPCAITLLLIQGPSQI